MMRLKEDEIIKAITDWMADCDADEFARVTGELFGGTCYPVIVDNGLRYAYDFEPDENYCGAFGTVEENS